MSLLTLPDDLLLSILLFLNANNLDGAVSKVCKNLETKIRLSNHLWSALCLRTGKISAPSHPSASTFAFYRELYYQIPCVPEDVPNISKALQLFRDPTHSFTVTLLPGVYREQINIKITSENLPKIDRYHDSGIPSIQEYTKEQAVQVYIRAAFPDQGAAILNCSGDDQPCVNVFTTGRDFLDKGIFHLELQNLTLLHYTKGNNLWNGNACARVDGPNTLLTVSSCTLQSDSGRGIVATRGAKLWLRDSTVHDCAATGVYVGDAGSFSLIQSSNIIRNGFGTRISNTPGRMETVTNSQNGLGEHTIHSTSNQESYLEDGDTVHERVPPGHSGVYVESTGSIIDNCLLAGNSLTGLSVVRGGSVKVKGSDLIDNGDEPLTFEEMNDMLLDLQPEFLPLIRGGIDNLGGNLLGRPVQNPLDLESAKQRLRATIPIKIRSGHFNMADIQRSHYLSL